MLAAIIIVSIPRLSAYLGEKKIDYFNRTANQILNALVVIVVPAMVGLIALSKNIVFIIAGQEYVDANISLKILSVALLFSIFSWFYTSCILIPYRCENKVLMATIVAALVNIGLNFILIPTFQQNAAAFTTVIAELLSMVITWWYGRKYFRVSFLKKDILSVAIGCLAIWTICSISEKYINNEESGGKISFRDTSYQKIILFFYTRKYSRWMLLITSSWTTQSMMQSRLVRDDLSRRCRSRKGQLQEDAGEWRVQG